MRVGGWRLVHLVRAGIAGIVWEGGRYVDGYLIVTHA